MSPSVSIKPNLNLLALSHAWAHELLFQAYKNKGHFSLYLLEAMSRSPLPGFAYHGRKHPLQKHEAWYGDFARDLKIYYRAHEKEIRDGLHFSSVKEAGRFPEQLGKLVDSFGKGYQLPTKRVVLTPNVYGAKGEGYGPLIGDIAYAIFTPDSKKDQTWLMVHEVCHSLLLLVFKSKKVVRLIRDTEPLFKKWTTKKFREYYPKWEWAVEEYMIHAIEQRVTGSSLDEKRSWGMNRLGWFVKSWEVFQSRREEDARLTVEDWVGEVLEELKKTI